MQPLRRKRLLLAAAILFVLVWRGYQSQQPDFPVEVHRPRPEDAVAVREAFEAGRSGVWLQVEGSVIRILRDDGEGSRHQRFILDAGDGLTVLVSHNIDLAPRLPLAGGDRVQLRGRYEWNERGGVIHWTHHDPGGRESGGWVDHEGVRYR